MARIGQRNCLCRLMEGQGGEQDTRGHETENPIELCKFWAEIVQLSAQETLISHQQSATATHKIETAYFQVAKPKTTHWIEHADRKFHIESIDNVGNRNRDYVFLCGEELADE